MIFIYLILTTLWYLSKIFLSLKNKIKISLYTTLIHLFQGVVFSKGQSCESFHTKNKQYPIDQVAQI